MPRIARFKIAAIEELLRQLEYAPLETRRRQMGHAEKLIDDIDPTQNYPEEFIIFRITGYRSDRAAEPVTFVGEALLPDLVNLVQILSAKLDLSSQNPERLVLSMAEVGRRLKISHKSIQRYRKQGLICHYFIFPNGVKKLGCYENTLQRFMDRHTEQLQKAAIFTRVDSRMESDIIEKARRLRETEDLSLNEAASRLAVETGRAHETIRMMLRRHDRRARRSVFTASDGEETVRTEPIFSAAGPLSDQQIQFIHRAWKRGSDLAELAQRTGKSKATVHRTINRGRRDLLLTVKLPFIELPTFDRPDAADIILSAPAVTSEIGVTLEQDVLQLIENARSAPVDDADKKKQDNDEPALLAAYNFLKMRAVDERARLDEHPTTAALDAIETDLRRAANVRRKLLLRTIPAAVRRIDQNLRQPMEKQPTDEIVTLMHLAFEVMARSIDEFDLGRGKGRQTLDRVIGLAMDKALAKRALSPIGRASARHTAGSIPMRRVYPPLNYQYWLDLRPDLEPYFPELTDSMRRAVVLHYGLNNAWPLPVAMIADQLQIKPIGVARLLQLAIRTLRALARKQMCHK